MSKMMNFADGSKEITVGMEVASMNAQNGRNSQMYVSKVASVGSKFATLENGFKFELATGRKQTDYPWGLLYSSATALIKKNNLDQDRRKLASFFSSMTNSLTEEQIDAIKNIVKID